MKLLLVLIIMVLPFQGVLGVDLTIPDLELESKGALLMEPVSGEILWGQNIHQSMPPASLTKIMTLLILMEALEEGEIDLHDKVLISSRAEGMGGSEIWLEAGEEFLLEDLMKAVAVSSANDASVALAEHLYGSERLFVQAMNKKTQDLGLSNTVFGNTSGLPLDGEESKITAHDIAIIARELLLYPKVLEWTSIWLDYLRDGETELNNTNRLVVDYPGVDGLKTGWTDDAGYCVVATGVRNGVRLLAVILNHETSKGRFEEGSYLLSFGFGLIRPFEVFQGGEFVKEVEVRLGEIPKVDLVASEDLIVPVPRGVEDELMEEIRIYPDIQAPISEGEELGEVLIWRERKLLGRVQLVAKRDIPKAPFFLLVKQLLLGLLGK